MVQRQVHVVLPCQWIIWVWRPLPLWAHLQANQLFTLMDVVPKMGFVGPGPVLGSTGDLNTASECKLVPVLTIPHPVPADNVLWLCQVGGGGGGHWGKWLNETNTSCSQTDYHLHNTSISTFLKLCIFCTYLVGNFCNTNYSRHENLVMWKRKSWKISDSFRQILAKIKCRKISPFKNCEIKLSQKFPTR